MAWEKTGGGGMMEVEMFQPVLHDSQGLRVLRTALKTNVPAPGKNTHQGERAHWTLWKGGAAWLQHSI